MKPIGLHNFLGLVAFFVLLFLPKLGGSKFLNYLSLIGISLIILPLLIKILVWWVSRKKNSRL